MTREEQKAELIRHRNEIQNDFGWNTSLLSALDAAIEDLSTEPNRDCVSKKAALTAMCIRCPVYDCISHCMAYKAVENLIMGKSEEVYADTK